MRANSAYLRVGHPTANLFSAWPQLTDHPLPPPAALLFLDLSQTPPLVRPLHPMVLVEGRQS